MFYKNLSTYNTYRKTIHGSIPDCRKIIEEHRTVKQHQFGTFTLADHFLTLALVWRTFWILKCTKQGTKPARRLPGLDASRYIQKGFAYVVRIVGEQELQTRHPSYKAQLAKSNHTASH